MVLTQVVPEIFRKTIWGALLVLELIVQTDRLTAEELSIVSNVTVRLVDIA